MKAGRSRRRTPKAVLTVLGVALSLGHASRGAAQTPAAFGTCIPMGERAGGDVGCFIITDQPLGKLGSAPVFWHVTRLGSAASSGVQDTRSTIVNAFGENWLLTVADSSWRPPRGTRVALIGPLPIDTGIPYTALYMEATMTPGMKSAIHRHSGPEAWYTLSGQTCLETPDGTRVGRAAGDPVIVPGGLPMELTATGSTLRKSLVLILHDASRPPTMMESAWKPRGLCKL